MIDKQCLLSDNQSITVSAASENIYDMGSDNSMVPADNQKACEVMLLIGEQFEKAEGTLYVILQGSDTPGFSEYKNFFISESLAQSELQPGRYFRADYFPHGFDRRYARFYYTVANGPFTAGKMTAALVIDKQYMPSHVYKTLHLITEDGRHITTEDGRILRIG